MLPTLSTDLLGVSKVPTSQEASCHLSKWRGCLGSPWPGCALHPALPISPPFLSAWLLVTLQVFV